MSAAYHIVIPARMASQRLPGKPLLEIAGEPLLQHVYRQACKTNARSIVIATDNQQIFEVAKSFDAKVVMTSTEHESGSDRIAECAQSMNWTDDQLIVNLQGDEPLMPPACLDQVAGMLLDDSNADVASLFWRLEQAEEIENPNIVKVVTDRIGYALYFSRSVVPYPRSVTPGGDLLTAGKRWKRHIGLYAYRVDALKAFTATAPTPLEKAEKLEQLRFLESGRRIKMDEACAFIPPGVDTSEDLQRVRNLFT